MPSFELGPARPVGAVDVRIARQAGNRPEPARSGPIEPPASAASSILSPGDAPVDTDRVAEIRKAIESGNYPVIPMKVADAMIAAGFLLRSAEHG